MRLLTIAFLALSMLLAGCAGPQGGGVSGDSLLTSETQFFSFQRVLPLPVSTKPGDQLYGWAVWGVDIVEILADGQPVAGKPSYMLLDDPGIYPITVQSGSYIYTIDLDDLFFGKRSPLGYSLVEYSISEDATSLEIRYRLIPYDGTPSERVYTVKAVRAW
ncbi:hypothetical protein [Pelagibius sp.]|uniref:hypothetical protein n=1 Tax=Pelagibius sp. TaxID=1931238 RepID=UPI003B50E81C